MTGRDLTLAGAGAVAFATAALATDEPAVATVRLTLLGAALGAAASIDMREHRVPNWIVGPASIACLALLVAGRVDLVALAPALVPVVALLTISLIAPAALGMGDVKLALLLVLGVDGDAPVALAAGFALAAACAVLLLARDGRAAGRRALPLGPFLATGALAATALG